MTATRGSAGPMVSEQGRVRRFGSTERTLHWVNASAFFAMLATGLVLYLPFLAQAISARPLMKAVHLAAACAWLTALVLVVVLGDRGALRRTRREIERFDDDLLWLRRRPAPQGRFNAGQKAHTIVQAALAVLFTVSGTLLWLGERDTALRFGGTIALHDVAMYVAATLVAGHLYMAFAPATRPALEGILHGSVPAGWAREHHAKWVPDPPRPPASVDRRSPGLRRIAVAAAVLAVGLAGATLLVRDVLDGRATTGSGVAARTVLR